MATRNGVEVVFKGDNSDLLRAIRQNVEAFGDMRRQTDQHLDAVSASARRTAGVITTSFDTLNATLRAADTRLAETARHIDRLGDEADTAAAAVRRLDTALAGLGRFGGLAGFGGVGGVTGGVFATNSAGTTAFVSGATGGGAAAAAGAAGAAAGGAFRGGPGPGPSFTSNSFFGVVGPPPTGGGAATPAAAAAVAATAAGMQPAGIFRGPGGRFMNEAQMLAATGQGPIIEGSLASAEDAGAAFRAAQAAQIAEVRARREAQRMASGLPDPDENRLGGGLLWNLAALAHLRPRGYARVGLSMPGMAINEVLEGRAVFTNPLTDETLSIDEMIDNRRQPMKMYPIPPGAPPGLIPDPSKESFWTDDRYGRHRLGAGLGGQDLGGGTRDANTALKTLGVTAAAAGAAVAAGLAAGLIAVVALKDQAKAAVDAFTEAETGEFRMAFQFRQAGLADQIEQFKKFGDELEDAVPFEGDPLAAQAVLARAFGTPDEIKRYTRLAADLSAVTGRDLVSSAEALVKASAGSTRLLKDFGIDLGDLADEGENAADIFGLLEQKVSGAGEAFAQTNAGQLLISQNQWDRNIEAIGERLAPAFAELSDLAVDWLDKLLNPAEGSGLAALQASLDGIDFGPIKDGFSDLGGHTARIVQEMQIDLAGWVQEHDEEINDMVADFGSTLEALKPVITGFFEWFNWNIKNTIIMIGDLADALAWVMGSPPKMSGAALNPPITATFNLPKGTEPGSGPKGPRMHSGGKVTGGLPGEEVWRLLQVGEEVNQPGGGSMRPIVINTGGSRYQRMLLDDVAQALRGQGLQVITK